MSSHAETSYTERKSSWVNPGVWGIVAFVLVLYLFITFGTPHEDAAAPHKVEEKSHH